MINKYIGYNKPVPISNNKDKLSSNENILFHIENNQDSKQNVKQQLNLNLGQIQQVNAKLEVAQKSQNQRLTSNFQQTIADEDDHPVMIMNKIRELYRYNLSPDDLEDAKEKVANIIMNQTQVSTLTFLAKILAKTNAMYKKHEEVKLNNYIQIKIKAQLNQLESQEDQMAEIYDDDDCHTHAQELDKHNPPKPQDLKGIGKSYNIQQQEENKEDIFFKPNNLLMNNEIIGFVNKQSHPKQKIENLNNSDLINMQSQISRGNTHINTLQDRVKDNKLAENSLGVGGQELVKDFIPNLTLKINNVFKKLTLDDKASKVEIQSKLESLAINEPEFFAEFVKLFTQIAHAAQGTELAYATMLPIDSEMPRQISQLWNKIKLISSIIIGICNNKVEVSNHVPEEIDITPEKASKHLELASTKLTKSLGVESINLNKFSCYGIGNNTFPKKPDPLNNVTINFKGINPLLLRCKGGIICNPVTKGVLSAVTPNIVSFSSGATQNLNDLKTMMKNRPELLDDFSCAFVNTDPDSADNRYGQLTPLEVGKKMSNILEDFLQNEKISAAFDRYQATYELTAEEAKHSQVGIVFIHKNLLSI